jgi:hypothetical protein
MAEKLVVDEQHPKPTEAELKKLAMIALRAKIKYDAATAAFKEAQANLVIGLMDAGMFNQSTKALGDVKLTLSPNRYFDVDTAMTLVTEKDILESTVEVVDTALLKQHMTPIQLEKAMKNHDIPFKVALKPNVKDD